MTAHSSCISAYHRPHVKLVVIPFATCVQSPVNVPPTSFTFLLSHGGRLPCVCVLHHASHCSVFPWCNWWATCSLCCYVCTLPSCNDVSLPSARLAYYLYYAICAGGAAVGVPHHCLSTTCGCFTGPPLADTGFGTRVFPPTVSSHCTVGTDSTSLGLWGWLCTGCNTHTCRGANCVLSGTKE